MKNVINELLNVINKNENEYQLYNGHNVLYLPLHVPLGIPIIQFMKDFFVKYISLIKKNRQILKECNVDNIDGVIEDIEKFRDAYIQMHESLFSGNANDAYKIMEQTLKTDYFIVAEIKKQEPPLHFYRARSGANWTQEKDFYHIPFNMTYLCDSNRFSIPGYPSLYLGFTSEVCKKELRGEDCSCIELDLNNDLRVIDLTWSNKYTQSISERTFLLAYPVIAACYIVPFYCNNMKKECPEIKQKFKEQYVFPQFVTMFIKKYLGVEGIIYFTTRDENLVSSKDDGKNVALFPQYANNILYDDKLIQKFKWGNITTF